MRVEGIDATRESLIRRKNGMRSIQYERYEEKTDEDAERRKKGVKESRKVRRKKIV